MCTTKGSCCQLPYLGPLPKLCYMFGLAKDVSRIHIISAYIYIYIYYIYIYLGKAFVLLHRVDGCEKKNLTIVDRAKITG